MYVEEEEQQQQQHFILSQRDSREFLCGFMKKNIIGDIAHSRRTNSNRPDTNVQKKNTNAQTKQQSD